MKANIILFVFIVSIFAYGCKTGNTESAKTSKDSVAIVKTVDYKKMITAKIFVKKEKISDFIKAAKGMIDSTLKEPGCESYMLYQNPFEAGKLIFVETYKNQAAVDVHFASNYFKNFGPEIKDWLSQPSEVKIFDIAGVK